MTVIAVDVATLRRAARCCRQLFQLELALAVEDHGRAEAVRAGIDPVAVHELAGLLDLVADMNEIQAVGG